MNFQSAAITLGIGVGLAATAVPVALVVAAPDEKREALGGAGSALGLAAGGIVAFGVAELYRSAGSHKLGLTVAAVGAGLLAGSATGFFAGLFTSLAKHGGDLPA